MARRRTGVSREDNCGAAISTGDKAEKEMPVPALNQWGILALAALLSAAGARFFRNRKKDE